VGGLVFFLPRRVYLVQSSEELQQLQDTSVAKVRQQYRSSTIIDHFLAILPISAFINGFPTYIFVTPRPRQHKVPKSQYTNV